MSDLRTGDGDRPYVPSWCYENGPRTCACGHHEGYHADDGACNQRRKCGCSGFRDRATIMTELEMTKLCAEAVSYTIGEAKIGAVHFDEHDLLHYYDPLREDYQAMALVKKFELFIIRATRDGVELWNVWAHPLPVREAPCSDDLNRAIVECVALIQRRR